MRPSPRLLLHEGAFLPFSCRCSGASAAHLRIGPVVGDGTAEPSEDCRPSAGVATSRSVRTERRIAQFALAL